jgi:hypothetical protein
MAMAQLGQFTVPVSMTGLVMAVPISRDKCAPKIFNTELVALSVCRRIIARTAGDYQRDDRGHVVLADRRNFFGACIDAADIRCNFIARVSNAVAAPAGAIVMFQYHLRVQHYPFTVALS